MTANGSNEAAGETFPRWGWGGGAVESNGTAYGSTGVAGRHTGAVSGSNGFSGWDLPPFNWCWLRHGSGGSASKGDRSIETAGLRGGDTRYQEQALDPDAAGGGGWRVRGE